MLRRVITPLALVLLAAPAAGQNAVPVQEPRVRSAIDIIKADNAWTLEQQVSICEIPAPPFKEQVRGAEYRRRLEALGLTQRAHRFDRQRDRRAARASARGPTVVHRRAPRHGVSRGHRREGEARGHAAVAAPASAMTAAASPSSSPSRARSRNPGCRPTGTVFFVGNVGEEGPGNLRGVRHLFDAELKGKIDYFISVDGTGLGLTHRARRQQPLQGHVQGSRRAQLRRVRHSEPDPRARPRDRRHLPTSRFPTARRRRSTSASIAGGTSVNSIAFEASMEIDMRSESPQNRRGRRRARFARCCADALAAENARWPGERAARAQITMKIDTIGIRPANGAQTETSPIVQMAHVRRAARSASPTDRGASSTDANMPMSLGIPAITIDGGGRGDGAHSLGEWYDDGPNGWLGPQWAALLVATLAGIAPSS